MSVMGRPPGGERGAIGAHAPMPFRSAVGAGGRAGGCVSAGGSVSRFIQAGSSAAGAMSTGPDSAAEARAGSKPGGAQRSGRRRASAASLSHAGGGFVPKAAAMAFTKVSFRSVSRASAQRSRRGSGSRLPCSARPRRATGRARSSEWPRRVITATRAAPVRAIGTPAGVGRAGSELGGRTCAGCWRGGRPSGSPGGASRRSTPSRHRPPRRRRRSLPRRRIR